MAKGRIPDAHPFYGHYRSFLDMVGMLYVFREELDIHAALTVERKLLDHIIVLLENVPETSGYTVSQKKFIDTAITQAVTMKEELEEL